MGRRVETWTCDCWTSDVMNASIEGSAGSDASSIAGGVVGGVGGM